MSQLGSISVPKLPFVTIEIVLPNRMIMKGTITTREPGQDLSAFFRSVHAAARADRLQELRLDVTGLTFVNSSAVRLFVDWATWVKNETGPRYKLVFIANRKITWQNTSFAALRSLMGDAIAVEHVD
jgi:hypothetical protein